MTALGIGMLAAIWKVTLVNGFRMGWQGIPVYLALAAILGRIATRKVVLHEATLVVINPLRRHRPRPVRGDHSSGRPLDGAQRGFVTGSVTWSRAPRGNG